VDPQAARFLHRVKAALDALDAARLPDGEKLLAMRAAQSEIARRFDALAAGDEPGRSKFIVIRM